jgi:hypothetical protein
MFILTLVAYFISTAYWGYSAALVVERMVVFNAEVQNPITLGTSHNAFIKFSLLFNAVPLINYVFNDAVVVWRAWVISWRTYRKYLWITIVFLVLTAIGVIGIIVFRTIELVTAPYADLPGDNYLVMGTNLMQIGVLSFSLMSNISATAVVGATAWRHRQRIRAAFADRPSTKANQILILIVESGVLYCISALTVLVASLIRLPHGTLGDIYTPINVQIAGAYPPVVLLLVSMQQSLAETTFLGTSEDSIVLPPAQFGNTARKFKGRSGMQFRDPTLSQIESQTARGSEEEEVPDPDTDTEMTGANDQLREKKAGSEW